MPNTSRKTYWFLITLPLVFTATLITLMLLYTEHQRSEFIQHHNNLSSQALTNLQHQLETFLQEKKRSVEIYVRAIAPKLAYLHEHPGDEGIIAELNEDMRKLFPYFAAFTVTLESGQRVVDPFMEKTGETCQRDIDEFLKSGRYGLFLHPGPGAPHIDMITRWSHGEHSGAFLISLLPDILIRMINNSQPDKHNLYLLRKEHNGLIEISSLGLRQDMGRESLLSSHEKNNIIQYKDVHDTKWQIVDIFDEDLISSFNRHQLTSVATVFAIYLIVTIILTALAVRETNRSRNHMNAVVEARVRAEQASLSKSHFVSNMSHEFRTPLNAIIGFSDLIKLKSESDDSQFIQYIDKIHNAGEHMLHLVDDILRMADIDIDETHFTATPVEVIPLINDVVEIMTAEAKRKNVQILFPQEPAVSLLAETNHLRVVLTNLLSNAITYNHDGGQVEIVINQTVSGRVRISFTDTGIGIPVKLQYRVFEPFERFGAHEQGIEGTGIGLVICKKTVTRMGGEIGFNSVPDSGSTFWVEFAKAS